MALPLEGIRILSLEQFGAGPFGTLHLADLGAEVIKIEDPAAGGDVGRYVPPYAEGEDSLFFETFNRGKKSVSLNLQTPLGREVFERLVKVSDAVFSNLRGDVPEKIGLTYAQLRHLNPKVVCCSLSGYGMTGPRRSEPGYDYVVQALAGWMDITGEPDGPPTKSGLSIVDFSSGYVAALALMAGLHAAARDGVGMDCDISLYDTAIAMLSYPGVWHLNAGFRPVRTQHSAHPSVVPFQAFEASDGWFVIAAPKEKFWQRVTQAIERPELAGDPRFRRLKDRQENAQQLLRILDGLFLQRPVAHWVQALGNAGVPVGAVNSVERALNEPQTLARGLVVQAPHPRYGSVKTLASPVRVGNQANPPARAPQRGEHTASIVQELAGLSAGEYAVLRAAGVFGAVGEEA